MPIISSFFGIYVRKYFADHGPPHIHVDYQGHEALVAIADGSISRANCRDAPMRWFASGVSTITSSWSRIGPTLKPCDP